MAGIVTGEMTVQGVEANDAIMTAWGSIVDCPPVDNNYLVTSSGGRGERGGRREEELRPWGVCNSGGRGWGKAEMTRGTFLFFLSCLVIVFG